MGARGWHKRGMHLYAYPVIFFKLKVSNYPKIVGIPLYFCRMPYLCACQRLAGLSGISVEGDFELIIKLCGQTCCLTLADKVDELEVSIDAVIHFSEFDYRYRKLMEYVEICMSQDQNLSDWMEMYDSLRERSEATEHRLSEENKELRSTYAEIITGIVKKVEDLATDCDARLQKLEQRDFMAMGLPLWERVKLFLQRKLGLIPIQEYRKMEVDIFRVTDELKEIQKRFGGED